MGSGYTSCKCRDCPDLAISSDDSELEFCNECEDSGCNEDHECERGDAYDCDEFEGEDPHAVAQYVQHLRLPST